MINERGTQLIKQMKEQFKQTITEPIFQKAEELFFKTPSRKFIIKKVIMSAFGPVVITLGIIQLIFSQLSIYTIIALFLIVLGIILICFNIKFTIAKQGFIYYLPDQYKRILLSRSQFDLLCDFWYIDNQKINFKAVFMPLLFKSNPEAAVKNLSYLDTKDRKIFLTKGLIFVLPKNWQKFLLSKEAAETLGVEKLIYDDPRDCLNVPQTDENNLISDSQKIRAIKRHSVTPEDIKKLRCYRPEKMLVRNPVKKTYESIENQSEFESSIKVERQVKEYNYFSDNENLVNDANEENNSTNSETGNLKKTKNFNSKDMLDKIEKIMIEENLKDENSDMNQIDKNDENTIQTEKFTKNNSTISEYKSKNERKIFPLTKVIIDSKNIEEFEKMPGMVDTRWDHLDEFNKNRIIPENILRNNNSKEQPEITIPNNLFGYASFFINNYFTKKVFNTDQNPQKLKRKDSHQVELAYGHKKQLVGSVGMIVLLLMLAPNTRKWSKTQALFAIYAGSVTTFGYSMTRQYSYIKKDKSKEATSPAIVVRTNSGTFDANTNNELIRNKLVRENPSFRLRREVSGLSLNRRIDNELNNGRPRIQREDSFYGRIGLEDYEKISTRKVNLARLIDINK